MPRITFGKTLLAALLLAVVVLLLVSENPDIDAFGPVYSKERFDDPKKPPKCPDCGRAGMELRYRRKDGEPFWGCRSYPRCHGTREWGGLKYAEFKWRFEDRYAGEPEEEMFYGFREMIGETNGPGDWLGLRCSKCYAKMVELDDEGGSIFYRCSRYPQCRRELHPEPFDIDPR